MKLTVKSLVYIVIVSLPVMVLTYWDLIFYPILLISGISFIISRKTSPKYSVGLTILNFSFLFGYIIRILLIYKFPSYYTFGKYGFDISQATILQYTLELSWLITLTLIGYKVGFGVAIKKINRTKCINYARYNKIITVFIIIVTIKIGVILLTGTGLKGNADKVRSIAFILKLVSEELIISFIIYYFNKYRKEFKFSEKARLLTLLLLVIFSIFITGSKAFVLLIGIALFICFIVYNVKVALSKVILLSTISVIIVISSFIISFSVRRNIETNASIIEKTTEQVKSIDFLEVFSAITERFVGFDGYIVSRDVAMKDSNTSDIMLNTFSFWNTILRIFDQVVPFFNFRDLKSSGIEVSNYLHNTIDQERAHGSAVGLFGAFIFYSGGSFLITSLLSFFWGVILGISYKFIFNRLNSLDEYIFLSLFSFFVLQSTISGNFDILISSFIINIILYKLMLFISKLT